MKIVCVCGAFVSDGDENSGAIASVRDFECVVADLSKFVSGLVDARLAGDAREWVSEIFGEGYPVGLSDESMFYDLFSGVIYKWTARVIGCGECGRMHVESCAEKGVFLSYAPDSGSRIEMVLGSRSEIEM